MFFIFQANSNQALEKFKNFFIMRPNRVVFHLMYVKSKYVSAQDRIQASRKDHMTKEQLGNLIISSEDVLYHVAKTLLRDDADCADAIQEAIVKAFSNIHTLHKDSYGKTWLIRIVINECYAIMRQKKKLVSLEEYTREERGREDRDYSDLYEAIARLSEETRLAVTLYYIEGYHVKEIAALMETTESTIKNRLARAREKLKIELEWAE